MSEMMRPRSWEQQEEPQDAREGDVWIRQRMTPEGGKQILMRTPTGWLGMEAQTTQGTAPYPILRRSSGVWRGGSHGSYTPNPDFLLDSDVLSREAFAQIVASLLTHGFDGKPVAELHVTERRGLGLYPPGQYEMSIQARASTHMFGLSYLIIEESL